MQKRRALSLFLVLVMVFSLLPGTVQASGETAAIAIQEKTITTSTTTVTVKVTGYEGLSNATLRLSVGPDGTESDWGISNPPRTALGSLKYTGPDTYTFAIDPAKLAAAIPSRSPTAIPCRPCRSAPRTSPTARRSFRSR